MKLITSEFYHKIFIEDCDDFENVRKEILKENNWLKDNYTENTFKVSDHVGVSVVYHNSGKLFAVAGLYEYNKNLARTFNRTYIFPDYRSKSFDGIVSNFKIGQKHILEPLDKIKKYPSTIVTMQNRRVSRKWVKIWAKACMKAFNDPWFHNDNYIKTCEPDIAVCYQNFIWRGKYPDRKIIDSESFNNIYR